MKSKNVVNLMNWLSDCTNVIDLPRDFTPNEVKRMVDIAETEMLNQNVDEKLDSFKMNWFDDCEIKSLDVKDYIEKRMSNLRPQDDLLFSESEVISIVEMAEGELEH